VIPGRGTDELRRPAEVVEINSRRRVPSVAQPNEAETFQPGWTPKPRFILVASEDEYLWSVLRALLGSSMFIACRFTRPEDASRVLRDRKVDLLVADQVALTACGHRLANDASAASRDLPVIVISGSATNDDTARLPEQRGWLSISIPFRPPELLDAIEKLLAMQPSSLSRGRNPAVAHPWRSLLPWLA
jgi:DNA-binding NtrC family response regulator